MLKEDGQRIESVTKTSRVRQHKFLVINKLKSFDHYTSQQFVNKLSRIPSEVAEQNASSALVIIGVVCALALIVAIVVIVKRKPKDNIDDKEEPGS